MHKLRFIQPRPAARPAGGVRSASTPRSGAAQRMLRLTARAWLPAALLRPRADSLPLDECVRQSGEW
jgi:hypothetical protein